MSMGNVCRILFRCFFPSLLFFSPNPRGGPVWQGLLGIGNSYGRLMYNKMDGVGRERRGGIDLVEQHKHARGHSLM